MVSFFEQDRYKEPPSGTTAEVAKFLALTDLGARPCSMTWVLVKSH
jgi:hypothetical protein